jgi:putative ABC transport system substrate-binding protein
MSAIGGKFVKHILNSSSSAFDSIRTSAVPDSMGSRPISAPIKAMVLADTMFVRSIGVVDMRRREFIAWIGGGLVAWPSAPRAQKSPVGTIGYLSSKDEASEAGIIAGMRKGLAEQGLLEGQNVSITYRWSAGDYRRLPELAADLVTRKVDVIAASGLPAALAAKAASSTVPVVFRLAIDPIAFGLAQSFDRPGGNLTGVTMLFDPLTPKKLQILHELVSDLSIGLLVNPSNPNATSHKEHAETAAQALGLRLTVLTASSPNEIEPAFALGRQKGIGALLVGDDPMFDVENHLLVGAASRYKIPTMYYVRDFVVTGGLLSYGPSFDEMAMQVGIYVGRILRGTKPADLPIQQPTKFELVISVKTAKGLGLTVPPSLLARADEVIE